ncbi:MULTISPECIES: hypothetical protein [unclassified Chitinophaga]|uniref:hypothetical protein n=1 Tax=unclassified Chitinophaga TaxID=2619133 RepID=UPI0009D13AD9|nr:MULTISPECIES: hypothetical protein [unclassified Chitinophaga]OMP80881.1 hypothetical protein BW716_02405 [[Flexibacter] sp. ATCC 35208]WPV69976.1 hypothetical protein QQL36_14830 [Chitinophaga sp. LS1]
MNIENKLDKLKKIRQVEAPPFLYNRILHKMEQGTEMVAPIKWRLTFALLSVLIILLNITILIRSKGQNNRSSMEQVASSMKLSTTNEFYDE